MRTTLLLFALSLVIAVSCTNSTDNDKEKYQDRLLTTGYIINSPGDTVYGEKDTFSLYERVGLKAEFKGDLTDSYAKIAVFKDDTTEIFKDTVHVEYNEFPDHIIYFPNFRPQKYPRFLVRLILYYDKPVTLEKYIYMKY